MIVQFNAYIGLDSCVCVCRTKIVQLEIKFEAISWRWLEDLFK